MERKGKKKGQRPSSHCETLTFSVTEPFYCLKFLTFYIISLGVEILQNGYIVFDCH